MEPVAITVRGDGECVLIHRCLACHQIHLTRIAGADNLLPLLGIAMRPLSRPALPLEWLGPL
jgi:hypothetical protein